MPEHSQECRAPYACGMLFPIVFHGNEGLYFFQCLAKTPTDTRHRIVDILEWLPAAQGVYSHQPAAALEEGVADALRDLQVVSLRINWYRVPTLSNLDNVRGF